jgi:hypothetical protein
MPPDVVGDETVLMNERPVTAATSYRVNILSARQRFLSGGLLIYLNLWIVEGAFRKWIPDSQDFFYVFRDGVIWVTLAAALLLFGAEKNKRNVSAAFWTLVLVIGTAALVQVVLGTVSLPVTLAGLRNYISPLIVPYIVWRYEVGTFARRACLVIAVWAPIQAGIAIVQVLSPRSSFLNLEVGGDEAFFTTAGGVVRASGTFSAPGGLVFFVTVCLAVGIAMIVESTRFHRLPAWLSVFSAVLILTIGGSRGAVFAGSVVLLAWAIKLVADASFEKLKALAAGVVAFAVVAIVTAAVFPSVLEAFRQRFVDANAHEDTIQRVLSGVVGFLSQPLDIVGSGSGSHSTIGIALGSVEEWVEGDPERWVAELGVLGLVLVFARLSVTVVAALWIARNLRKIPVLLVVLCAVLIPIGFAGSITTSPASQGYFGVVMGMALSAFFVYRANNDDDPSSTRARASEHFQPVTLVDNK